MLADRRTLVALLCAGALAAPATAQARNPDRAFQTPIAHGAAAAQKSVSAARLSSGLRRVWRRAGKSSAFVMDAAAHRVLFARRAGRPRILASNTKLFTTSTALARFGPETKLQTTVWSDDDISDGTSQGLYLQGMGDPTLSAADLSRLADRIHSAGVNVVLGPLTYDDSFLDQQAGVPEHGISFERLGTLSGLTLDGSGTSDPGKLAAQKLQDALRRDGVQIGNSIVHGTVPPSGPVAVGAESSPSMASLIQATNVPSNNYFAEMLLKDVGGAYGDSGSTGSGIAVVKRFASDQGASFNGENGSGLSRVNRASPASVVKLLDSMVEVSPNASPEVQAAQTAQRDAWIDSLAVAGRSGTLAHRMRGTAARGRCHAKTGTLAGVSALSGYCFKGGDDAGHAVIFSILNNGIDVNRAHVMQDRMAALIARYSR